MTVSPYINNNNNNNNEDPNLETIYAFKMEGITMAFPFYYIDLFFLGADIYS